MKKYLLGIVAVIFELGLSAFTVHVKQPTSLTGEKWFKFNGVDPADLNDPTKYQMDGDGSAPTVCTSTTLTYRCEVFAVPQGGNPSLPNLSTIAGQTKRTTP